MFHKFPENVIKKLFRNCALFSTIFSWKGETRLCSSCTSSTYVCHVYEVVNGFSFIQDIFNIAGFEDLSWLSVWGKLLKLGKKLGKKKGNRLFHDFQLWPFSILTISHSDSSNFDQCLVLTISVSDIFWFWQFPIY